MARSMADANASVGGGSNISISSALNTPSLFFLIVSTTMLRKMAPGPSVMISGYCCAGICSKTCFV
uniref:Uncharacterized protein L09ER n=1 Tax=African swine fever virus TaxID=10497 RepID=Q8V9U0_ASF|nr:putative protein [African swine fever virus]